VHTGSRNFGLKTCLHHQKIAKELCKNNPNVLKDLEYLENEEKEIYIKHMKCCQMYAQINRNIILSIISEKMNFNVVDEIESIHNYINFEDNIIRKGAISAHRHEMVIVPLNMRDGIVIGEGLGKEDWNFSAPHGAGRKMSRSQARKNIEIQDFKQSMENVYSTCISEDTIDESPMAYKESESILKELSNTVNILDIIKPIYSFKSK